MQTVGRIERGSLVRARGALSWQFRMVHLFLRGNRPTRILL
ncbi:unannotated protein [freshwater metagenome]|uniref:Unannotated protein n=1 Tax=freshwater metagenome TaxID=449393 RepID=A0A6J7P0F3_9ZZZZ